MNYSRCTSLRNVTLTHENTVNILADPGLMPEHLTFTQQTSGQDGNNLEKPTLAVLETPRP